MRRSLLVGLVAGLALAVPGLGHAATLYGTVGPGKTITVRNAAGAIVKSVRAGSHTLVVRDRSSAHNFRLVGLGVNRATGVRWKGRTAWRITFRRGKIYAYRCDPHKSSMSGSFRAR